MLMPSSAHILNGNEWIFGNEFAQVRVTIDTSGNDPRLKIEDFATGNTVALDAFTLSGLTTMSEAELARIMDPNPKDEEPN
jgi:hypothetical protein